MHVRVFPAEIDTCRQSTGVVELEGAANLQIEQSGRGFDCVSLQGHGAGPPDLVMPDAAVMWDTHACSRSSMAPMSAAHTWRQGALKP